MTGIIGAGFGLYGYLPAVLQHDENVCLLSRAKEKFLHRPELQEYASRIYWVENVSDLFSRVDTIIISTPPGEQLGLVTEIVRNLNIKNIILEKPLAITPGESKEIIRLLQKNNINFRICYSFAYLEWFRLLQKYMSASLANEVISISWSFKANHYHKSLYNWKRYHNEGGGVIRFFGIHLIAIAAMLEFCQVLNSNVYSYSKNDFARWKASVVDGSNNVLHFDINSDDSQEKFEIVAGTGKSAKQFHYIEASPFSTTLSIDPQLDKRVSLLSDIYSDLKQKQISAHLIETYFKVNESWQALEDQLQVSFLLPS